MSSGSPRRFSGRRAASLLAEVVDEERGEVGLHEPGAMPTTRVGPSSFASCRVRWISAALVRLYTPRPASARSPPTDAMLMIMPGLFLNACLQAAWLQNSGALRFTWNVLSYGAGRRRAWARSTGWWRRC